MSTPLTKKKPGSKYKEKIEELDSDLEKALIKKAKKRGISLDYLRLQLECLQKSQELMTDLLADLCEALPDKGPCKPLRTLLIIIGNDWSTRPKMERICGIVCAFSTHYKVMEELLDETSFDEQIDLVLTIVKEEAKKTLPKEGLGLVSGFVSSASELIDDLDKKTKKKIKVIIEEAQCVMKKTKKKLKKAHFSFWKKDIEDTPYSVGYNIPGSGARYLANVVERYK